MNRATSRVRVAVSMLTLLTSTCVGCAVAGAPGSSPPSTTAPPAAVPTVAQDDGVPVRAPAPTTAPPAALRSFAPGDATVCEATGAPTSAPTGTAPGHVTVDADPVGATLVWLPGLNATPCAAQLTTMEEAAARRLAQDLRGARPFPPGATNCPADQGTAVEVFLRFSEAQDEAVTVGLTGCGVITAPGWTPRLSTEAIRDDLDAVAPAAWKGL